MNSLGFADHMPKGQWDRCKWISDRQLNWRCPTQNLWSLIHPRHVPLRISLSQEMTPLHPLMLRQKKIKSFWPLSFFHTLYEAYQEILLALHSKYIQIPATSQHFCCQSDLSHIFPHPADCNADLSASILLPTNHSQSHSRGFPSHTHKRQALTIP